MKRLLLLNCLLFLSILTSVQKTLCFVRLCEGNEANMLIDYRAIVCFDDSFNCSVFNSPVDFDPRLAVYDFIQQQNTIVSYFPSSKNTAFSCRLHHLSAVMLEQLKNHNPS